MTTADLIDAALRDGEALVKWAEPNEVAREDESVDELVQAALRGPVPDELRGDGPDDPLAYLPLLRFANTARAPLPLLDATVDAPRRSGRCDRCRTCGTKTSRLVIPAGMSAVAIYACAHCRGVLQDVFACELVWD